MTRSRWLSARILAPLILTALSPRLLQAQNDRIEFFESRIRPVLAQDCYECHSSNGDADGGLVLDHREGLLKGGDRGPAIVPGDPDQSLLIQAIRHADEDLEMPSAAPKLDGAIIRDFEHWIRTGAIDPRDGPPTADELAVDTDWSAIMERRKRWWSFQPIGTPSPPVIGAVEHRSIVSLGLASRKSGSRPQIRQNPSRYFDD